jgi:hypothetical protein
MDLRVRSRSNLAVAKSVTYRRGILGNQMM